MTLTLELTPAQERKLRAAAAQEGVDPATLLLTYAGLLETEAALAEENASGGDTRRARFQEWQERWLANLPPTPVVCDEDITREAMYARSDDETFQL